LNSGSALVALNGDWIEADAVVNPGAGKQRLGSAN
jgi:hypothetical protein